MAKEVECRELDGPMPPYFWVLLQVTNWQHKTYGRALGDKWDWKNADLLLLRFGGSATRATAWIDLVFSSELRRSAGLTLAKLVCWSLTPLDQIDRIVRAWLREKAGRE